MKYKGLQTIATQDDRNLMARTIRYVRRQHIARMRSMPTFSERCAFTIWKSTNLCGWPYSRQTLVALDEAKLPCVTNADQHIGL